MHFPEALRNAKPATLRQVLDAREERAYLQRQLLATNGTPLITFTINMPGEYKDFPLLRCTFAEGCAAIRQRLAEWGAPLVYEQIQQDVTGSAGFFAVDIGAEQLKRIALDIEENHPLGRLFDIDVIDLEGKRLHRSQIGVAPRRCFICDGPVWQCSRSRAHPVEQLTTATIETMQQYFTRLCANRTSAAAVKALLYEVCTTPKPGLVDRANTGAHRDMSLHTFLDSTAVLGPYFTHCAQQGLAFSGTPAQLLASLRGPGRQAEQEMLRATRGVNTHKGLIFSLGLLCAALGYLRRTTREATPEMLAKLATEMGAPTLEELEQSARKNKKTAGESAYLQFGLTGARGEAAAGYPNVMEHGYPALLAAIAQGGPLNDAGVVALLHLLAHVQDTNIVARAGYDALAEIQRRTAAQLAETQDLSRHLEFATALDREFIARNISPGGCADLLAVSLFFYFIFAPPNHQKD